MRVPLELFVRNARVVGPREDLLVQSLHVVALVERVDHGLPIRRDDRAAIAAEAQLVELIGREQGGQRVEEVEQGLGVEVHVDEHETTPGVDADRPEREVVGESGELLAVGHLREPAVERVRPRVVGAADRPVGERSAAIGEASAAVQARVVEADDLVGLRAYDDDRVVADRVLQEGAGPDQLFLTAGDLPYARPEPLELELRELAGRVALLRQEAVRANEEVIEGTHARIGL
jgi:hypothetical protein